MTNIWFVKDGGIHRDIYTYLERALKPHIEVRGVNSLPDKSERASRMQKKLYREIREGPINRDDFYYMTPMKATLVNPALEKESIKKIKKELGDRRADRVRLNKTQSESGTTPVFTEHEIDMLYREKLEEALIDIKTRFEREHRNLIRDPKTIIRFAYELGLYNVVRNKDKQLIFIDNSETLVGVTTRKLAKFIKQMTSTRVPEELLVAVGDTLPRPSK